MREYWRGKMLTESGNVLDGEVYDFSSLKKPRYYIIFNSFSGNEQFAKISLWGEDLDWYYLGMSSRDPTSDERIKEVVKTFVEACKQAIFMGWVKRGDNIEFRISMSYENPIRFYFQADECVPTKTPPTFHFDKDPNYEIKRANVVRWLIMRALKPHYRSGLDKSFLLNEIGLDETLIDPEINWLIENGYVTEKDERLWITDTGISYIDGSSAHPSPIPSNVVIVGEMSNSVIQQAGTGSTQSVEFNLNRLRELRALVNELKQSLPQIELDAESKAVLESDVNTLEVQLNSPRPKSQIISECINTIRDILTSAGGSFAAAFLAKWMGLIP
ncbi:MAG: hypothetical protein ABIK49_03450 [candidate division WOR-3 bacterium]